jgi:hypothetical protein
VPEQHSIPARLSQSSPWEGGVLAVYTADCQPVRDLLYWWHESRRLNLNEPRGRWDTDLLDDDGEERLVAKDRRLYVALDCNDVAHYVLEKKSGLVWRAAGDRRPNKRHPARHVADLTAELRRTAQTCRRPAWYPIYRDVCALFKAAHDAARKPEVNALEVEQHLGVLADLLEEHGHAAESEAVRRHQVRTAEGGHVLPGLYGLWQYELLYPSRRQPGT